MKPYFYKRRQSKDWGIRLSFKRRGVSLEQQIWQRGEFWEIVFTWNGNGIGTLGVIQEGVYADILLIDGNPMEDLLLLINKDKIPVIMKDGKIFKNTLSIP